MIGWTVILVSNVFVFPKATCQLCWTGVPMSKCQFLGQHPVCGHTTCTDSSTAMLLQQTNKQTNGCTWVDENPQAFLPFFLSFLLLSCVLACCRTLNTSLQTLRVSVWCLLAASQAHQQATGAKLEVHIRHPWLITGLLVGLAIDTHKW